MDDRGGMSAFDRNSVNFLLMPWHEIPLFIVRAETYVALMRVVREHELKFVGDLLIAGEKLPCSRERDIVLSIARAAKLPFPLTEETKAAFKVNRSLQLSSLKKEKGTMESRLFVVPEAGNFPLISVTPKNGGTPIPENDLSPRVMSYFGIRNSLTVEDLTAFTEAELLNIPRFGKQAIEEIREFLRNRGLSLKKKPAAGT